MGKPTSIRFQPEELAIVDKFCRAWGLPAARVVGMALREFERNHPIEDEHNIRRKVVLPERLVERK